MTELGFYGTGRRKTSVARVWIRPGQGGLRVNERPVEAYFVRTAYLQDILQPLKVAGAEGRFDVMATVCGGGLTGQAGAVRLGISRALVASDPGLRVTLKKHGFLTRDPRVKERKKYGQPGARARFQFSKR
ncbi:MAG TPA: 30S ribosomal protein S9 [Candidatus Methylomirabilis sp.]|jgi:small subunit ribosomal protein S9